MLVLAGRRLATATEAVEVLGADDDSERLLLSVDRTSATSLVVAVVVVVWLAVVTRLSTADSVFSGARVDRGGGGGT